MRIRRVLTSLLAGATLAGCSDLDVTNPNQQSGQTFWQSSADAERGLTAAYNGLQLLGVYSRWHVFANDLRSDIGTARESPWGDLANFVAFQLNDYNFEINRHLWVHNYELISRANLVIANVPAIEMNETDRSRIVGEAKFLRGLAYWNLVTLYENVPLVTAPPLPDERPAAASPAATWAQIEQDFADAAAALPATYPADQSGRVTRGAALGMLGKARLQQRNWAGASEALGQVITAGNYSLLANYADNFEQSTEIANSESLFEVQNEDMFPIGVTGMSFPKMVGPCYRPGAPLPAYDPTFCDGRPTRWYFEQFQASRTANGEVDPRLDVTILYDRPERDAEMIYGRTRGSFFEENPASPTSESTQIFFRKYGEHDIAAEQRWDNPINYRVLRYADVLLMQAEALNEAGQTGAAFQHVNAVRARVGKSALAGLTQPQLRDSILTERMFELGLETSRWTDLLRHNLLSPALVARDPDFANFVVGRSERLPIPTTERNLNPNVPQNPGW